MKDAEKGQPCKTGIVTPFEETEARRSCDLPKVTQLCDREAGHRTQARLPQNLSPSQRERLSLAQIAGD